MFFPALHCPIFLKNALHDIFCPRRDQPQI
jgi:hypothetical protein